MFKNKINSNMFKNLKNSLDKNKYIILGVLIWAISIMVFKKYQNAQIQTITVVGNATEEVSNQIANFSLYINSKSPDRQEAIETTQFRSDEVLQSLRDYNIDDSNIKIANMNIFLDQNYINDRIEEGDWNASINIDIKIDDIDRIDRLTELLSGLDVNNFFGPNFSTDTTSLDETEVINLAIRDANKKAEQIASEINKKVVDVISISEDSSNNATYYPRALSSMGGNEFLPGTTNVYKSVVITYQVK